MLTQTSRVFLGEDYLTTRLSRYERVLNQSQNVPGLHSGGPNIDIRS